MTQTIATSSRLLCSIRLLPVHDNRLAGRDPSVDSSAAELAVAERKPIISEQAGCASLALPIMYDDGLQSIALFTIQAADFTGVLEIWSPVGSYGDLKLTSGYFGELDRFQNVSSHVRFEHGAGLPGQSWSQSRAVLHDHLRNHPGFLRAAGASADDLQTAIAFPVFVDGFVASAVLISSLSNPLAKGVEVWAPDESGGLSLNNASYTAAVPAGLRLPAGAISPVDSSLMTAISEQHDAVFFEDPLVLLRDRDLENPESLAGTTALALPTYQGTRLRSIVVLLL